MTTQAKRMGALIALEFNAAGEATDVRKLPSVSQAKAYVRTRGLQVTRGDFTISSTAVVEEVGDHEAAAKGRTTNTNGARGGKRGREAAIAAAIRRHLIEAGLVS